MTFSTTTYFLNLAIVELLLLAAAIAFPKIRRPLLIFCACVVLFYVTPRLIIIYACFWVVIAALVQLQIRATSAASQKAVLIFGIVFGVALLLLFKLFPLEFWIAWNKIPHDIIETGSVTLADVDALRPVITAIGLSFAVFRAIDLLIKIYIGKLTEISFVSVIEYGFFAPVLISGPIIEFEEIQKPAKIQPSDVLTAALIVPRQHP